MTCGDDGAVLGFDTSGTYCAAAIVIGDRVAALRAEEMGRGQAERLFPMLAEVLAEAGLDWRDLEALGVGTGPGNFTGLRIAVAAARGLALGLGVPAIGVTGCAARQSLAGTDLPAIPAPRGQVWLCDGSEIPALMTEAEATNRAAAGGQTLKTQAAPDALAVAVARIAAERRHERLPPPAPLYARPADAAPARDLPPLLLD